MNARTGTRATTAYRLVDDGDRARIRRIGRRGHMNPRRRSNICQVASATADSVDAGCPGEPAARCGSDPRRPGSAAPPGKRVAHGDAVFEARTVAGGGHRPATRPSATSRGPRTAPVQRLPAAVAGLGFTVLLGHGHRRSSRGRHGVGALHVVGIDQRIPARAGQRGVTDSFVVELRPAPSVSMTAAAIWSRWQTEARSSATLRPWDAVAASHSAPARGGGRSPRPAASAASRPGFTTQWRPHFRSRPGHRHHRRCGTDPPLMLSAAVPGARRAPRSPTGWRPPSARPAPSRRRLRGHRRRPGP